MLLCVATLIMAPWRASKHSTVNTWKITVQVEMQDAALWRAVLAGGFELWDGAALHEGPILVLLLQFWRLDAPGCLRLLQTDGSGCVNWQILDCKSAPSDKSTSSRADHCAYCNACQVLQPEYSLRLTAHNRESHLLLAALLAGEVAPGVDALVA